MVAQPSETAIMFKYRVKINQFMGKVAWFILLLALFSCLSYADAGPPPHLSFTVYVKTYAVHLMLDGKPIQETVYATTFACVPEEGGPGNLTAGQVGYWINTITGRYPHIKYIGGPLWTSCKGMGYFGSSIDAYYEPHWYYGDCNNGICYIEPNHDEGFAVYIPSMNRTFVSNQWINSPYLPTTELGSISPGILDFYLFPTDYYVNIDSTTGDVTITTPPTYFGFLTADYLTAMLQALLLTLIVELITSFVYLHLKKLDKKILMSVVLVNIISVPSLWVFLKIANSLSVQPGEGMPFPAVGAGDYQPALGVMFLIIGELAVFIFEAIVIFLLNKKRMKLKDAFAMSLINNLASFLIGLIL